MDYRDPDWVAERLGLDRNTVYRFLQEGTIPALQLGRKWLISEARLEQWLADETDRQTRARRDASDSAERTSRRMDNFSPPARRAVRSAHAEARGFGHTRLSEAHLLIAMADEPGCQAAEVLGALNVSAERLREALEFLRPRRDATPPRRIARTDHARRAMRLAEADARDANAPVTTGRLLLGILQLGEGDGATILKQSAVKLEDVRGRLADMADESAD